MKSLSTLIGLGCLHIALDAAVGLLPGPDEKNAIKGPILAGQGMAKPEKRKRRKLEWKKNS